MTIDEIQLLRDFRTNIPAPDEEATRRAYAYATSDPRAARRLRLRLPATSRVRISGIAAIAAAAALIGVFTLPGTTAHHNAIGDGSHSGGGSRRGALAPNPVPLSQAMDDALNSFGAPLILPDTSVLKSSDAESTASEEWVPSPTPGTKQDLSQVTVQFPSPFVSITYSPTVLTSGASQYPDPLDQYRTEIAQATNPGEYQIISLSDGTPALVHTSKAGNAIEFRLGKLSITIWAPNNNGVASTVDGVTLQTLAQSMVSQAATTP